MSLSLDIWRKASPRRKRIYSTIAIFVFAVIITGIGSLVPVDAQEANQINDNLNQTVTSLGEEGVLTQFIFGNNFIICLLMFIPVLGPLFGFYALFNTGIHHNRHPPLASGLARPLVGGIETNLGTQAGNR